MKYIKIYDSLDDTTAIYKSNDEEHSDLDLLYTSPNYRYVPTSGIGRWPEKCSMKDWFKEEINKRRFKVTRISSKDAFLEMI